MAKVRIDDLTKEIMKTLEEYVGVTEEACERGVKETAKTAAEELRSAHPSGSEQWGSWDAYNRGWTVKNDRKALKKGVMSIVHNKDHYQLTHLLEKGHAKTNGGRTRAFPHIAPVAEKAEDMLIEKIKREI